VERQVDQAAIRGAGGSSDGRPAGPSAGPLRLAELIRQSRCTVALTGAGVSVPSGIPDFRTPETGLWANVDPMEVAHIDVFERDPARFWSYYRPRFQSLGDKRPNGAHEALAELERRGLLAGVITQNIDRLHRAGGSRNVVEVHGSIETSSCTRCADSRRSTTSSTAAGSPSAPAAAARSNRTSSSSASCCPRARW
jgi:NAD-dependent deacetylase